jgi:7-dehydrocholesterol reductase
MVVETRSATKKKKQSLQSEAGDWSTATGLRFPGRDWLGPLFLMATTPVFSIVFYHVCSTWNGDFIGYLSTVASWRDAWTSLRDAWPTPWDGETWKMLAAFSAAQLAMMRLVPGGEFRATVTPAGHVPVYRANGTACYVLTLTAAVALAASGAWDPAALHDRFGTVLSSLNVAALALCAFLTVKGRTFPSTADSGATGSWIQDYFWGTELYPRVLGFDVKQFTNCRFGMMSWAVLVLAFCYKNAELNSGALHPAVAVSAALQLMYIFKFFHWEMGYMCSMDIQHDRAGYYLCWGCLVWVPAVYTSGTFYLTTAAVGGGGGSVPPGIAWKAAAVLLTGWLCIWINYDSDNQRYVFRQTKGKCKIWGRSPPKHIKATYQTVDGETKQSLLLMDGWWTLSRHFHYIPEILASVCWCTLPAAFLMETPHVGLGSTFYPVYLTILLTDRAFRDDTRCRNKYGVYWTLYCDKVPYKIVPGLL